MLGFHVLTMAPPSPRAAGRARWLLPGRQPLVHSVPSVSHRSQIHCHLYTTEWGVEARALADTLQAHVSPWTVFLLQWSTSPSHQELISLDSSACSSVCHPVCLNSLSASSLLSGKHLFSIESQCETQCLCGEVAAGPCASLLLPTAHPFVW